MLEIKKLLLSSEKSKEIYDSEIIFCVVNHDWLLMGAPIVHPNKIDSFRGMTPYNLLMRADLHKTLNKIVAKQNVMIEGKYKKARLYLFETEHFYISATCETGDKGSFWCFVDKDKKLETASVKELLKYNHSKELGDFFKSLMYELLINNEEYMKDVKINHNDYVSMLIKEINCEKLYNKLQEKIPTQVDHKKIKI